MPNKTGGTKWKFLLVLIALSVVCVVWVYFNPNQMKKLRIITTAVGETICIRDEDCVLTSYSYDCCGVSCLGVVNRVAFEKRKQWTIKNCKKEEDYAKCDFVDCWDARQEAICKNYRCARITYNEVP